MQDALDGIKALQAKSAALVGELERSLALRSLWPEVFDHGRATSYLVTGTPRRDARGRLVQEVKRLVVRDGAGEERTFPADVVPPILRGGLR